MRPDLGAADVGAGRRRRDLLKAWAVVTALAGCGPLTRREARAAIRTGVPYGPRATLAALKAAGAVEAVGPELEVSAPHRTDDAAVVPVTVTSRLADTRELVVVIDPNPIPVATRMEVPPGTEAHVSLRVRLAESGLIYAVARTGRGLFWASCATEVESNGCE